MCTRLLLACAALPLFAGCANAVLSSAPGSLPRAPVQDAETILQTLNAKPARAEVSLEKLGLAGRKPAPKWLATVGNNAAASQPAAPVAVAVAPPMGAPAALAAANAAPADEDAGIRQVLEAWRHAWQSGDAPGYLRFYDAAFHGDARSRGDWERQRAARLANGHIQVAFSAVQVVLGRAGEADVRFTQHYASGRHSDVGEKRLKLKRADGQWRIVQESWTRLARQ